MATLSLDHIKDSGKLLKIARELYSLYSKEMNALPYRMNIISELHANENAHSRILRGLFQFSTNDKYPILQSFITKMCGLSDFPVNISVESPVLTNETNRIDLLIREKNKYAIIIENKIWDAVDQDEQIERYVNYILSCQIPKNKIIVVYLTGDGTKEICDYSLTANARKMLGMTQKSDGRFICMNFKNHIVPWLEEVSQLEWLKSEHLLSAAIVQYLDYLKEVFGLRTEDILIENKVKKTMTEKLQLSNLQDILRTWEEVNKLNNLLSDAANERISSVCESKIITPLKKKGYQIVGDPVFSYYSPYFSIEVEIPEFSKCHWKIEEDKGILYSGLCILEGKKIAKKYLLMMKDVYDNVDDTNQWWAGWKWHDITINDDFWIDLESHPARLVNLIVNEIERVREATKGMTL